ncbi:MAG: AmmeMemoRadiSam system protein B [Candidatus Omnitrophica bacterium]|nr:AmmeMemoRadiSam system protein B [Candidatus Omnitrophota bacterium]
MFFRIILFIQVVIFFFCSNCLASSVKWPEHSGDFYPSAKEKLSKMIDDFLDRASSSTEIEHPVIIISPHAGYGFSGQTAAFGYKLIKNKNYKTVIIIGTSHHKLFDGAALYGTGSFITILGQVNVDKEFLADIANKDSEVFEDASVFSGEHSIEVQLPFLQKVLTGFSIVPMIIGDCSLETCEKIAHLLAKAIGQRKDVLVVVSTDLYHGYDFQEADTVDSFTLGLMKKMDYRQLYYALRDETAQACGGLAAVVALSLANELGIQRLELLNHTNSALVTGKMEKGVWTVGYASCAVAGQGGEGMLTPEQKRKLLKIARESILVYLKTGKKIQINESDLLLTQKMGAFVTLNQQNGLRGCIGSLVASQSLYLTVQDMAIEAAVGDPRFSPVSLSELKDIQIEISVLSPMEKVNSAENVELGKHGVLVRRNGRSGVFLPQVATETGWSKDEFLSNLCAHKAGIAANAWKDRGTELYIFTADVFSEKEGKE